MVIRMVEHVLPVYSCTVDEDRIRRAAGPWDRAAWDTRLNSNVHDSKRLAAVASTRLLDSAPDESFDQLARLAAAVLGVPWVFVTLVDDRRSFWVNAAGVDPDPTSGLYGENRVEESFCQYVIGSGSAVIIGDARLDSRSDQNPSIESIGVAAWAGFPLQSAEGQVVGTFCAVDCVAREWSGEDITLLQALATAATSHLQLRATLAVANESARELLVEMERREVLARRAFRCSERIVPWRAGAVGVGWSEATEFTPMVRSLLTTVSEMCAQALDRSQVGDARTQFVRSLQYALLSNTGARPGLDIAAEYIAANNALGFVGDWYDFIHLSPTRTALVVGDICGHGIEAAARMTQIRGSINALVSIQSNQLGRLFDRAEQQLNLSASRFVATLSVHIIDTDTNTISYVSAGHPPALLVDEFGVATLLEGGRRPVLGIGGPAPKTVRVDFNPGSILVAYTDGLVEQRRNLDDGIQLLSDTVRSAQGRTARQISAAPPGSGSTPPTTSPTP
jgi:sigma-B regulation protein RsbU (phosphoserine phosphatase)